MLSPQKRGGRKLQAHIIIKVIKTVLEKEAQTDRTTAGAFP